MSQRHYSIGLEDRDRLNHSLGGGFPRGSIVLLEGGYGDGKSILAQRMTKGFCEEGYYVSYLSTELTASGFLNQMHSLAYDVDRFLLEERLHFLAADVDTQATLAGEPPRRELLTKLMQPLPMWRADVVIVDTLDAILRNDVRFSAIAATGEAQRAIQNLVSYLRQITAGETTVVLTVDPQSLDERALRPLRELADVYFQLTAQQVGQSIRRSVVVRRFVGMANRVNDSIGFSVQPNRGIVVESRTVA